MRLFAWADSMREKIHHHVPPIEQASVECDLAVSHSKWKDSTFASLVAEGRILSLGNAVTLALEK